MKRLLLPLILLALQATPSQAANVLSVSTLTCDSTIISPESFEVDVKKMRENWYLQNYIVLDDRADRRPAVQIDDETIIERLSKLPTAIEMPFNTPVKTMIMRYSERRQLIENMLGLGQYYMPIFEEALDRYGLPLELRYLPIVESALNPTAVSRVGATGLWQFMLPTSRGLNLETNSLIDERRDPYISSDAAARYLKELYQRLGDWSLAIAAYNCGPGNVSKAVRRADEAFGNTNKKDFWDIYPFLPAETRNYVPSFIAVTYIMNYYPEHGIAPALVRRPIVTDTVHVNRRVHFEQIAEVLAIPKDEIQALNPQYLRDEIPGDIRPSALVLPSLQAYAYIVNEDSIVNHRAADFARRRVVEPAAISVNGSDSNGEYVQEEVVQYYKVRRGDNLSKIAAKFGVSMQSIQKTNKIGKSVKAGQTLKIVTYRRKYVERPKSVETSPELTAPADTTTTTPAAPVDAIEEEIIEAADQIVPGNMEADEEIDVTDLDLEAEQPTEPKAEQPAQAEQPAEPSQQSAEVQNAMKHSSLNSGRHKNESQAAKADTAKTQQTQPEKTAKPKAPSVVYHRVAKGENLFKISKRYGVTIDAIKAANGLNSDKIQLGQRLKIPAK